MKKTDDKPVKRTILITEAHVKFLNENESINLSGFVRDKLDEVMAEGE